MVYFKPLAQCLWVKCPFSGSVSHIWYYLALVCQGEQIYSTHFNTCLKWIAGIFCSSSSYVLHFISMNHLCISCRGICYDWMAVTLARVRNYLISYEWWIFFWQIESAISSSLKRLELKSKPAVSSPLCAGSFLQHLWKPPTLNAPWDTAGLNKRSLLPVSSRSFAWILHNCFISDFFLPSF